MTLRRCWTVVGWILGIMLWGAGGPVQAQDDPFAPVQMDTLEVVGLTPTHGLQIPVAETAQNVQVFDAEALQRFQPLGVADALESSLASVHLTNLGSNPLQPEVSYRGFRGSPLLGLPQGIAVYLDGARVNETFGDVVNWDLVPDQAVASVELIPGSNPLFGLNTLGGALSLQTKSGFSHPGASAQVFGGSYGRANGDVEFGAHGDDVSVYATAEYFREDGWREQSNSRATSAFGKATWIGTQSTVEASVQLADTRLRGNGAVPVELAAQSRSAVFTFPDETSNRVGMLNLRVGRRASEHVTLTLTTYGRITETDTFNGDDSDYGACPPDFAVTGGVDPGRALCLGGEDDDDGDDNGDEGGDGEGEPEEPRQVFDADGRPVLVSDAVDSGTQNTSTALQQTIGGSAQVEWRSDVAGGRNTLVAGVSGSAGWVDFASQTELARLTDARGTVGSGIVDAGSFTEVKTLSQSSAVYVVNAYAPSPKITLTASARLNRTDVKLDDQLGTALNGDHGFTRFNPSLGVSYRIAPEIGLFGSVSTSNRAPTPVELTCADPDDPCRLPNGFQADPPLDQVVATTVSGGVRGQVAGIRYAVALFRTDARNDIYFVSAGPARNSGYFTNIGTTRRQGVEVSARAHTGRVHWWGAYTGLAATFESDLTVPSPNHPLADEGELDVGTGSRLPLNPSHQGRVGADLLATKALTVGASVYLTGEQYVRGDEANLLAPIDPFALVHVQARYRIGSAWEVFGKVSNLFDTRYETAGLLGEPDEVEAFENFDNPRFITPGAPRFIRLGIEYDF